MRYAAAPVLLLLAPIATSLASAGECSRPASGHGPSLHRFSG